MVLGCGVGGAGASRTIENYWNTNNFHGFGLRDGGRGCLQNYRKLLKYQRFIWFCVVGWGARVPAEPQKIIEIPTIYMVLRCRVGTIEKENYWNTDDLYGFALWGGGRGRLQNYRKLLKYQRFMWFCVVGWEAWVPPDLQKIIEILKIYMVLRRGVGGAGASTTIK